MKKRATNVCPQCVGFRGDPRGLMTSFTVGGVWHTAPDMWLASRSTRHGGTLEAYRAATADWAEQCALAARFQDEQKVLKRPVKELGGAA